MEKDNKTTTEETKNGTETETTEKKVDADAGRYAVLNEAASEEKVNVQSSEISLSQSDMQYLKSKKEWSDLVPEDLAKLLVQQGFRAPSRIQSLAVPTVKARTNSVVIAQSQNGSGKTLAFLIPTLLRINKSEPLDDGKGSFLPQAIVLIHVKELCTQTLQIAKKFEPAFPDVIINVGDPRNLVKSHMLICTPGNLLTIISKKMVNLSNLKILAVDEADYVLTNDVGNKAILAVAKAMTAKEKQFLFFSATYAEKSIETIKEIKKPDQDVLEFLLPPDKLTLEGLLQLHTMCKNKIEYIETLISNLEVETQTIIFANTRNYAMKLLEYLVSKDHKPALLMGGDMPVEERDLIFTKFKKGDIQILITTNVLARGVDNRSVGFVINLDMPLVYGTALDEVDVDMYLHRIGRTGRFADVGVALNLLSRPEEKSFITKLEKHYNCKIPELKDIKELNKLLAEAKEMNNIKRKKGGETV